MYKSKLHQRLSNSRPIHCFSTSLSSMVVPHMVGSAGADCLWFDCEHFPTDSLTMYGLIEMAHGADADAVVRVPNGRLDLASLLLDAGADAIMYPRVSTVEEVRGLVDAVRFPPIGHRGIATLVPASRYGASLRDDYMNRARDAVVIVQIETEGALQSLDAIASVKGIDLLFLGLGDLSVELGVPLEWGQPLLADALDRVATVSAEHHLHWGTIVQNASQAEQVLEKDGLFVAYGSDCKALRQAAEFIKGEMSQLGIPVGRLA